MNDNQDGRPPVRLHQGPCLHVWTLKLDHLSPDFFQIYMLTTFIKLLFMSEYGFCPMNTINHEGGQNGYPIFTAGHYAGPFFGVRLFSYYNLRSVQTEHDTFRVS